MDNFPHSNVNAMLANNDNKVQKLLNLIGNDAFARLCRVFGGKSLHVSNSVMLRQQFNVILGQWNANKVLSHFNDVDLTLPSYSILETKKRHQAIIKDARNGMSCGDVAVKYEMTYQQARRIIYEICSF